jgi:hypothetical protein
MDTVGRNDGEERNLGRCADCNAIVVVEEPCGPADRTNVCAVCGMTLVESPFEGSDYFDVIMRARRPIKRGRRG